MLYARVSNLKGVSRSLFALGFWLEVVGDFGTFFAHVLGFGVEVV